MHDLLFARPRDWSHNKANETFVSFAQEIGLADIDDFTACVDELRYLEQVRADADYGVSKGVTSTPSFFINEQPLIGAQPINVFNEAIATVLGGGELANTQPEAPPQPTPIAVSEEGMAAMLGSDEAPYTIVEFTNYGCDSCAKHAADTLPKMQELLIDPGQIRYLLKDVAGDSGSPEVKTAAIAARCAGEQDAYWPMHESLFANQTTWLGSDDAEAVFISLAEELALDADAFADCVESGKFDAILQTNAGEAQELGIAGFPHFIVEGQPLSGVDPNALAIALGLPMAVPLETAAFAFGDPAAPITIVEYTDYQCPFCTRHFAETLPQLRENFIDKGLVYYVIKDFPLTSIHPQAVLAATAARCAGEQDAYLEMHDNLFTQQAEWSGNEDAAAVFAGYADELGLDAAQFETCLNSEEMQTAVLANMNEGMSFGVSGTPAFFINGILVSGALPYDNFAQGLEGMLANLE